MKKKVNIVVCYLDNLVGFCGVLRFISCTERNECIIMWKNELWIKLWTLFNVIRNESKHLRTANSIYNIISCSFVFFFLFVVQKSWVQDQHDGFDNKMPSIALKSLKGV